MDRVASWNLFCEFVLLIGEDAIYLHVDTCFLNYVAVLFFYTLDQQFCFFIGTRALVYSGSGRAATFVGSR